MAKELCNLCPLFKYKAKTETPPEIIKGAKYCFIGEGPGKEEIKQRRPFVGPTGKLLSYLLKPMGLVRGRYSLINAVRCVNLYKPTPTAKAIKCCSYFFEKDLKRANPEHVICLGRSAWAALAGKAQGKVDRVRGKIFRR